MRIVKAVCVFVLIIIFAVSYSDFSYASWVDEDDGIKYIKEDGEYAIGFLEIDGKMYYFDTDGHLVTGKFYVEEADAYYYADSSGVLQYGAIWADEDFFVADDTGKLQTGFVSYDNKRYFFNKLVQLVVGWFSYQENWYYANSNGEIQTGFIDVDGYTYYLNEDGTRTKEDVLTIDGTTYYFNDDGSVDQNTTVAYPVLQTINTWRVKQQNIELVFDDNLQSCAIIRAAGLENGFLTEESSLENMLRNFDITCTCGYEFAYGGIEDYSIDSLIRDMSKDENLKRVLSDDAISKVGIGMYEQDNKSYYSLIFVK